MYAFVQVETECGDIRVASSYCDQAKFCTNRGNMHLRNVHNESYIAIYEQGDLKIHGIDGSTNIFVKQVSPSLSFFPFFLGNHGIKTQFFGKIHLPTRPTRWRKKPTSIGKSRDLVVFFGMKGPGSRKVEPLFKRCPSILSFLKEIHSSKLQGLS